MTFTKTNASLFLLVKENNNILAWAACTDSKCFITLPSCPDSPDYSEIIPVLAGIFPILIIFFTSKSTNSYQLFNPLTARAFFGLFKKKISKVDFVTQFLRTGSTKIQSFVVENFKLLRENVKKICPELQLFEVTTVSCRIYS